MTGRQLAARVRHWRRVLNLDHWALEVFVIDGFDDAPESFARCNCEESYDQADLAFKKSWLEDASAEDLDVTVVHELLHVYMRDFDQSIERVDDQLSKAVADLWNESVKHEREGVVDRLSRLIVSLHN